MFAGASAVTLRTITSAKVEAQAELDYSTLGANQLVCPKTLFNSADTNKNDYDEFVRMLLKRTLCNSHRLS